MTQASPASPSADPTPDSAELFETAVTDTQHIAQTVADVLARYRTPQDWPLLAAQLQTVGRQITAHGAALAEHLHSYAEAHPRIEVPPQGPSVLLLDLAEHRHHWDAAVDLAARHTLGTAPDADPAPGLGYYAQSVAEAYGRPELGYRAHAIDDAAVAVVLHLEADPSAVVAVYVGGYDTDEPGQVAGSALPAWLAEQGITPGPPTFWPPAHPDGVLGWPEADALYDAYGRLLARGSDRYEVRTELLSDAGVWETYSIEPCRPEDIAWVEVSAADLEVEPGQRVRLVLVDARQHGDDRVVATRETSAV